MKKSNLLCVFFLSTILLAGCGETDERTKVVFYGWGNESEVALTQKFVDDYNASQNEIKVEYTSIPSDDYGIKIRNALATRNPPDVLIAGDGEIKPWIEMGGLANLDEYIENSEVFDLSDFWEEGQNRYLYNTETRMNGSGHYYGVMRDLSPTVLFYNKTAFKKIGIECISLSKEEAIAQYGEAKGFFEKDGKKYFNNQIAMDWEQMLELSKLNTSNPSSPYRNNDATTTYGIHYVNWFSLGWSVGVDSVQFVKDSTSSVGGRYEFSLNDDQPNYSVKEGNTLTVRGTTYNAGDVISYDDRESLTPDDKEKCNVLPSALEAMQFYVDLSATHKIAPNPDFTASTSQYQIFASGTQASMVVDSR